MSGKKHKKYSLPSVLRIEKKLSLYQRFSSLVSWVKGFRIIPEFIESWPQNT